MHASWTQSLYSIVINRGVIISILNRQMKSFTFDHQNQKQVGDSASISSLSTPANNLRASGTHLKGGEEKQLAYW